MAASFAEVWVSVALTQQGAVERREGTREGVTLVSEQSMSNYLEFDVRTAEAA